MKGKKIVVGLLAALSLPCANAADSLFVPDARIKNEINVEKLNRELAVSSKEAQTGQLVSQRRGMKLNISALDKEELDIELSDGSKLKVAKSNRYKSYSNSLVWIGIPKNGSKAANSVEPTQVFLVQHAGKLVGTIFKDDKVFQIRSDQTRSERDLHSYRSKISI